MRLRASDSRLTDPSTEGGGDTWSPTRGEAQTHGGDKKAR